LQNVVKHSGATMAIVRLVATARNIRLHVGDGGKGFDRTAHTGAGLGLSNIAHREPLVFA